MHPRGAGADPLGPAKAQVPKEHVNGGVGIAGDQVGGERLEYNEAAVGFDRGTRRVLDDHAGEGSVLLTQPSAYVLQVAPDGVDAVVFERLLVEGRRLLAAGDARGAATHLAAALGMWRGPPLADVSGLSALQAEIRRLDELRLLATVERNDAELGLGHHAELVPALESPCATDPLQERFHEQLALALYRSGRQPDALAVYRRASDRLRELGLEPAPTLRVLEHRMLRHDPTLDHREPPGRAVERPITCLASYERSDAEFFCGRDQLVRDLTARLAGSRFLGIVGPSGIGKSSLLAAGVMSALAGAVYEFERGRPWLRKTASRSAVIFWR